MTTDKDNKNSVAVFPFLKTSGSVPIGRLTFRSTDDTDGLTEKQARYVNEIGSMLFLKDNLRIRSASYAIIPFIDFNYPTIDLDDFVNVQNVVAYFYASPRHEFGDLFLTSEHASMAIFSPGLVHSTLVCPDFHTVSVEPKLKLSINKRSETEGYSGLYNFRHHFWVTKGSRLYGPQHHLTLNRSQDLKTEFNRARTARADYRLLCKLLNNQENGIYSRVFNAIRWFNAANNAANDTATSIVNLAIAYEALLSLPTDEKTNRLTDSISLLLGRVPRLDCLIREI